MDKSNTKYIAIICLILVLALGLGLFTNLKNINKIEANVDVLPKDASLYMNDQPINRGNLKVYPGTYTFKAIATGYDDDVYTVIIKKDSDIRLLPTPNNQETISLYNNDQELQSTREEFGSIRSNLIGASTRSNNEIINNLPIEMFTYKGKNGPFSIDYGFSEEDKGRAFLVVNNSSPNGRANALQWIRDQGYSTSEIEILFSDYANPLKGTD